MIKARNIHKHYGTLHVLKGIDLDIETGQMVALVGASGAGKSTLLHILGTLDNADKGEVWLNDKEVHQLKERELAGFRNKHIGFVYQFHHLLPEFTALENICIPALIRGDSWSAAKKNARELAAILGISERLDHKPNAMSGGEQQRVAVARALVNKPSLILADEPSGNLDSKNADALHQLFLKLNHDLNQSFLIATHNPALESIAEKVFHIRDGKIQSSN